VNLNGDIVNLMSPVVGYPMEDGHIHGVGIREIGAN
jgi:hypothetical protein